MQFTYDLHSPAGDEALDKFESTLADNSLALALIAEDIREMMAVQFTTEGAARAN